MNLEEITLTKEQESLMIAMLEDMASADTELKQLIRIQKHMKIIWNHAQYQEREACAKLAIEEMQKYNGKNNPTVAESIGTTVAWHIAQAIRERSKK